MPKGKRMADEKQIVEEPEVEEVVEEEIEDEATDEGEEEESLVDFSTGFETYKVPPGVKKYVEDWRKSQGEKDKELAEARKAFEEERQSSFEQLREAAQKRGELAHADRMLKAYQEYDWNSLDENDPHAASRARTEWMQWRDYRDGLSQQIAEEERHASQAKQESLSKAKAEAQVQLRRDIPNWEEVGPQVAQFAMEQLGYSQQDLMSMTDPKLGKALHQAWVGSRVTSKAKPAFKPPEVVEPTKRVSGRGRVASTEPRDSDPIDVWMQKEQKRMKSKSGG
jgi:hypothetical protein